ncbi:hypothetical protein ACYPKM_02800 [Pseudomonas aeruginosa]
MKPVVRITAVALSIIAGAAWAAPEELNEAQAPLVVAPTAQALQRAPEVPAAPKPALARKAPSPLSVANQEALNANALTAAQGDDLERQLYLLEKQLGIEKVKLDISKTKQDRDKVEKGEAPVNTTAAQNPMGGAPGMPQYPGMTNMLQASKAPEKATLERLYVTRIYGIGDSKSATVYLDNSVMTASVGDSVADGVVLTKIGENGVTFSKDGKSRFVSLSTESQAYERTNKAADSTGPTMSVQRFGM